MSLKQNTKNLDDQKQPLKIQSLFLLIALLHDQKKHSLTCKVKYIKKLV